MKQLRVYKHRTEIAPARNWSTAKDFFPEVEINQETGSIHVQVFNSSGHQKKASITTTWIKSDTKGNLCFLRGEVSCKNWKHWECSGSQKFCFAIFEGDSGHIYIHRAPASKGWMNAKPEEIKSRLRKLGIGAANVLQQGDFLLKPVNDTGLDFAHETMGSGHHKFVAPVLYCDENGKRYYKVEEETKIIHHAVDDIQHPDLVVPIGVYVVGTTTTSLDHYNKRD